MRKIAKFSKKHDVTQVCKQLRFVYSQASEYEKNNGLLWYKEANLYLQEIANHFNLQLHVVTGICAALSPANSWNANLKDTYNLIRFKGKIDNSTTYKENIRKASKILKKKKVFPFLCGRKVLPFYDNILNYTNSQAITIDSHIIRCAVNDSNLEIHYVPPIFFDAIEQSIKDIASENNLLPLQVQAILWVTWKRLTFSRDTSFTQTFFKF